MAFLGGLGTVAGPVLGALIIEPGQLYLNVTFTNGYLSEILLGAVFLARRAVHAARHHPHRRRVGQPGCGPRGRPAIPPPRLPVQPAESDATKAEARAMTALLRTDGRAQGLRRRARPRRVHGRGRARAPWPA